MTDAVPLTPVDVAWLRMDTDTNLMVITAMLVLEPLAFSTFRDTVMPRLLTLPRLRQRPVLKSGRYVWEEAADFIPEAHLQHVALPEPADAAALQEFLSVLLGSPPDRNKPLWKLWYVSNYSEGPAVILRIHHCYADGLALLSLLRQVVDPLAQEDAPISPPPASSVQRLPWLDALLKELGEGSGTPMQRVGRLGEVSGRLLGEMGAYLMQPADSDSALRQPLTAHKACAWSSPVPIQRFRQLARAFQCKVNDVLMALVAGAMRRAVMDAGNDPSALSLHAAVPVDLRSRLPAGFQPADATFGNYFATVFAPLPVSASTPLERLYVLKHDMLRLKRSWQPGISFGLLYAAGLLPKQLQEPMGDLFTRKASAVVSNVPGERQTRFIAGARIRQKMFWVPQAGAVGLGVSIVSYDDQVSFGVQADRALSFSSADFLTYLVDELNALSALMPLQADLMRAQAVAGSRD